MKSNAEWREWGRRDPLYSALTRADSRRDGPNPWTVDEFYATGAADWRTYRSHWAHYGLDRSACLEIGCGPGRVTRAMVPDFDTIHAVDVSAEMIEIARDRVPQASVTFHLTDGLRLPLADGSVSAVLSMLVFQHFDDTRVAVRYLREVHRVMADNASLMIQLPVFVSPLAPALLRALYEFRRRISHVRATVRRRLMTRGGDPVIRGLKYEVGWLQHTLSGLGFQDVQIRIVPMPPTANVARTHSVVLARKSASRQGRGLPETG